MPFVAPEQDRASAASEFSDVTETMARGLVRGIPVAGPFIEGGIERLEAGFNALTGGGGFSEELAAIRTRGLRLQEDRPVLSAAAEVAGAFAGSFGLVAAAPRAMGAVGSFGQRLAASTASGGALGGVDAAVRGEDSLKGGAFGAAGGAAGVVIGGSLGRLFAKYQGTPSAKALQALGGPLFDHARRAGVVVAEAPYRGMVARLAATMKREGLDVVLHPRASRVMTRLEELTGDVSLEDLTIRRRNIGSVMLSPESDERRLAEIMTDAVDDWFAKLRPGEVLAGDAGAAHRVLVQARDLWHRSKRAEIIEAALERAELGTAAQDPATAIRGAFRNIANNTRIMRRFTPDQQKQIRKVAQGGELSALLQQIGTIYPAMIGGSIVGATLDPTSGFLTGAAMLSTRWVSRMVRAEEARRLAEGARQFAATGRMDAAVPSRTAEAVGKAAGLAAGLEVGREQ